MKQITYASVLKTALAEKAALTEKTKNEKKAKALAMMAAGHTPTEVANRLGVHRNMSDAEARRLLTEAERIGGTL